MHASEPILLLVTIYLSAIYGVLYGRAYPSPGVSISRRRIRFVAHSLRGLPYHLHRTPQPFHLPKRPHLPQPLNGRHARRPPQTTPAQPPLLLYVVLPRLSAARETTLWSDDRGPEFGCGEFVAGVVRPV